MKWPFFIILAGMAIVTAWSWRYRLCKWRALLLRFLARRAENSGR